MNFHSLVAAVAVVFGLSSGATTTLPSQLPMQCVTLVRFLSVGSTGADVAQLQEFLGVKNSGYFGPLTQQKMMRWQLAHSVIASANSAGAGSVGPKTRAALACSTKKDSPVDATSSPVKKIETTPGTSTPQGSSSPSATPIINSGGGGGGGYISPPAYSCPNLGAKPSAASCTAGQWQVIQDEAGCDVWDCSDASNNQG